MTGAVRLHISGESSSGLLCRLLGLFAQLDLPAPELKVSVSGDRMVLEVMLSQFVPELLPVVASKMARFVGVDAVRLESAGT
jgi:hypothetical protein